MRAAAHAGIEADGGTAITHPRQLEVSVRVDQAGQEHDVAEILARISDGGADADDDTVVDRDDAIAQRRIVDWKDPGGAVANQWLVRRAFFSAALLAT